MIYRKTDAQEDPSLVAEVTLTKALAGRIRLEGTVLGELGDGVYTVNVHGKDREVLGQYGFAVDSLPGNDTEKAHDVSTNPQQALFKLLMNLIDGQYDDE